MGVGSGPGGAAGGLQGAGRGGPSPEVAARCVLGPPQGPAWLQCSARGWPWLGGLEPARKPKPRHPGEAIPILTSHSNHPAINVSPSTDLPDGLSTEKRRGGRLCATTDRGQGAQRLSQPPSQGVNRQPLKTGKLTTKTLQHRFFFSNEEVTGKYHTNELKMATAEEAGLKGVEETFVTGLFLFFFN